jgi:acyl-CoA reductase-like NAD-dependent aldehyde dehydrogenase
MIEVVQAFDRAPITRLDSDDRAALDRKIEAARRLFADRRAWLKTHQRMEILGKLAQLMEGKREHLGGQIAREGGKPLSDALIKPIVPSTACAARSTSCASVAAGKSRWG